MSCIGCAPQPLGYREYAEQQRAPVSVRLLLTTWYRFVRYPAGTVLADVATAQAVAWRDEGRAVLT